MTERHRKKWVDALSLVLPVLLFFAVLNCFTTYLYYQDYQCKMDILTEVAAGAETTGMDVAAGWLKGNDHQANEQGKQLLEQYGYWENKGTSFYVRFRQNIMITGCTSAVLCLSLLTFLFYRKKAEEKESRKRLEQLEQILIAFRENHFEVVLDTEDYVGQERLKFQLEAIGHRIQLLQEEARAEKESTKEMVSDISHQLKTPVAALDTCFSILLRNNLSETEQQEFRIRCRSALDGLETLLQSLLEISKLETGLIQLDQKTLPIMDTIISAVNRTYPKAAEKGIELIFDCNESLEHCALMQDIVQRKAFVFRFPAFRFSDSEELFCKRQAVSSLSSVLKRTSGYLWGKPIGFICRFLQFQVKSRPHTCRSHVHWQSRKLNPCLSIAWNWQTEPLGFLKLLSICFR